MDHVSEPQVGQGSHQVVPPRDVMAAWTCVSPCIVTRRWGPQGCLSRVPVLSGAWLCLSRLDTAFPWGFCSSPCAPSTPCSCVIPTSLLCKARASWACREVIREAREGLRPRQDPRLEKVGDARSRPPSLRLCLLLKIYAHDSFFFFSVLNLVYVKVLHPSEGKWRKKV